MPSLLETIAFAAGAIYIWLSVRQNIWNFPVGLINVAAYCIVFFGSRLYADAGLQIVYFVLTAIGWYMWLHGGEGGTALAVTRIKRHELTIVLAIGTALTLLLWTFLSKVGGSASPFDSLTTSFSLCGQWLLNRKLLENWLFWIAVDAIYVPLYIYKELYLTAVLYAIFLGLAFVGYYKWRESWLEGAAAV
ncbi:MAG: nicotinamide mononucleotide transporter [Acidobacteria bacterium]|nr:nicotinamide mononucleotide transporter [Acidobacteriota bacterium]